MKWLQKLLRPNRDAHAELLAIHAVTINIAGPWPEQEGDTYTVAHVKWMARELNRLMDEVLKK